MVLLLVATLATPGSSYAATTPGHPKAAAAVTTWDKAGAAAYADQYAEPDHDNPEWLAFPNDCTNFISQSLSVGGGFPQVGSPVPAIVNDDSQWWANPPMLTENGQIFGATFRTHSWSVVSDLFSFLWNNSQLWRGVQDFSLDDMEAAWNQDITSGNTLPWAPGDAVFYHWHGPAFDSATNSAVLPDEDSHAAIIVASGEDENNHWVGTLVDEHTSNRKHVIWNLIPYNPEFLTTHAAPLWVDSHIFGSGAATSTVARPARPAADVALDARLAGVGTRIHADGAVTAEAAEATAGDPVPAAERAFERAMASVHQLASPQGVAAGARPSSAQVVDSFARGSDQLQRLYAGPALTDALATLRNAAHVQAGDGLRILGGAADHFSYSKATQVSADQVQLAGTVRAWTRVAQVQAGGRLVPAAPTAILDVSATVDRDPSDGQWRVSHYTWRFHPGSEP